MEAEKMHANETIGKKNSNKEICHILQLEGDAYLPPIAQSNHEYTPIIWKGLRKYSNFNDTLVCHEQ